MLHLPLSHVWYSLLYHNARLFYYLNRLLSIRPLLHTLPKKSNCYSVSSLHSLDSPLLHPSRKVINRISDVKLFLKTQFAMNVRFPSTILFSNFRAISPLSPLTLKSTIPLFSIQAYLSPLSKTPPSPFSHHSPLTHPSQSCPPLSHKAASFHCSLTSISSLHLLKSSTAFCPLSPSTTEPFLLIQPSPSYSAIPHTLSTTLLTSPSRPFPSPPTPAPKASSPPSSLTVWISNIQGLRSNLSDLSIQVATNKPDIICQTETFLPQDLSASKVSLPGYSLLWYDRPEPPPGGGVALFIKDSIPHSPCTALTPHTPRNTSGYGFPSTPTSCLYVYCTVHQTVMTPSAPHYQKTLNN
uniref:Endonuclease/exonuclease/phosphatase domain-containing protein n=1 Tax=Eptatretus burgeri TaxID=7764 RepID=A0A8C4Q8G0_EPTBU